MGEFGHDSERSDWQRAIERLVDGELSDDQQRELLAGLDDVPDGWRQVAVAFVEAQTLRAELGAVVAQTARPQPFPPAAVDHKNTFWVRPAGILLAMAACFLVAVSVGLVFRSPPPRPVDDRAVASPGTVGPLAGPGPHAADGKAQPPAGQLAEVDSEPWVAAAAGQPLGQGTAPPRLVLPVTGGRSGQDVWSRVRQPALPPHIRQLLEQLGHQVRVRRSVVPLDLPDGRRVVVPVEDFDVQFVGEGEYQ